MPVPSSTLMVQRIVLTISLDPGASRVGLITRHPPFILFSIQKPDSPISRSLPRSRGAAFLGGVPTNSDSFVLNPIRKNTQAWQSSW